MQMCAKTNSWDMLNPNSLTLDLHQHHQPGKKCLLQMLPHNSTDPNPFSYILHNHPRLIFGHHLFCRISDLSAVFQIENVFREPFILADKDTHTHATRLIEYANRRHITFRSNLVSVYANAHPHLLIKWNNAYMDIRMKKLGSHTQHVQRLRIFK